ncbi:hypothetical protein ABT294_16430 [Nonomuraea sp. NPDC000554]|uniref:hypothetical protein n=1 Tax=Nonomuraea sp. NPDC000554 TaxID=3154259 RepID=UPI003328DE63
MAQLRQVQLARRREHLPGRRELLTAASVALIAGIIEGPESGWGSTPVLSHEIMASLPRERAGLGSGLNSATRELGSAVGVAVMGTVTATHGMGAGYRAVAAVVLAGALLVARWLRTDARAPA